MLTDSKHLYRVQEHSSVNRMNAGNLAICFGYVPPRRRSNGEIWLTRRQTYFDGLKYGVKYRGRRLAGPSD